MGRLLFEFFDDAGLSAACSVSTSLAVSGIALVGGPAAGVGEILPAVSGVLVSGSLGSVFVPLPSLDVYAALLEAVASVGSAAFDMGADGAALAETSGNTDTLHVTQPILAAALVAAEALVGGASTYTLVQYGPADEAAQASAEFAINAFLCYIRALSNGRRPRPIADFKSQHVVGIDYETSEITTRIETPTLLAVWPQPQTIMGTFDDVDSFVGIWPKSATP